MNKRIQCLTVLLFVLILIMPVIQKRYAIIQYEPVEENRLKNKLPIFSINDIIENHSLFKKQYELYYDDSYGLRDFFIRLKHQIDYSVFKKSDRVFIGKDNWMYSKWICDKQVNLERLPEDVVASCYENTKRLSAHFKKKRIKLIFITVPNKNSIYPEYMTSEMPKRPDVTFFDKYRQFLNEQPDIIHIDGFKLLQDLKKQTAVFPKTDFHWNRVAEYYVARHMVNTISRIEGVGDIWHENLYQVVEKEILGGQIHEIPMLYKPIEHSLTIQIPDRIKRKWGKQFYFEKNEVFSEIFVQKKMIEDKLIPTTVFFVDSFLMEMSNYGGHIYFKKFYRANKTLKVSLQDVLENLPADTQYFVFERMEADMFDIFKRKDFYVPNNV